MSYRRGDGHLSVDVDKAPYPFNAIITTAVLAHGQELRNTHETDAVTLQDFTRYVKSGRGDHIHARLQQLF